MKERRGKGEGGRAGWERSWSGKAISRRTVWSRSVYWLNDKYFGGKEKRVKLKKSKGVSNETARFGWFKPYRYSFSFILGETGACGASEASECLAKGKVTNVRIFREINIVEILPCSLVDPQTADYRKILTHYWIKMTQSIFDRFKI